MISMSNKQHNAFCRNTIEKLFVQASRKYIEKGGFNPSRDALLWRLRFLIFYILPIAFAIAIPSLVALRFLGSIAASLLDHTNSIDLSSSLAYSIRFLHNPLSLAAGLIVGAPLTLLLLPRLQTLWLKVLHEYRCCPTCGYSLIANTANDPCPECGNSVKSNSLDRS